MQPNKVDLTNILKVGDKVFSYKKNIGIVKQISEHHAYPITVTFGNWNYCFTKYGFFDPADFFHELYPSSALEPWPQPCPFEKGELVWVSSNEGVEWWLRYFIEKIDGICGGYLCKKHPNIGYNEQGVWDLCRPFSECPLPLKIDVK